MRYVFVGEKRSNRAIRMGVTWVSERLAAATLFKALMACGIQPEQQAFINIYHDGKTHQVNLTAIRKIRQYYTDGQVIVGLGLSAQKALKGYGIPHIPLIHPAARGAIRKAERYNQHVQESLTL